MVTPDALLKGVYALLQASAAFTHGEVVTMVIYLTFTTISDMS